MDRAGTKHAERALGLSGGACFEELASIFASSGALLLAKIATSLKIRINDNPG